MTAQDTFEALKYRIEVTSSGTRCYLNADNRYHRNDGAAIEYVDGGKMWFVDGRYHSEHRFDLLTKK